MITDLATRPAGAAPTATKALSALTDREREVMALVAGGLSNDEIAARLYLSPLTAKTHVSRIMTKLSARDRAQLVVLGYETGLVTPGHTLRSPAPPGSPPAPPPPPPGSRSGRGSRRRRAGGRAG